ncbi:3'-5' exoribonuclease domain-containing protein [Caulobacter sp. RL271]|uniref:3'-5' exoribonuclease n=1 Tax=Caulobacter segnis TaxID=88688 RepID=A0ABY4ZWR4_9CAUL|nr:3'-5' exoribonuclease [Caulobacter segnis]USQ97283.1 3'-5' exoribonuclease [Caulobacter segnis]
MADIMLDLETLGTAPGCVIRSIGAVHFDPTDDVIREQLYVIIDRASCEAAGLTVDAQTEQWWNDQSPEARAEFDGKGVTLATALDLFDDFYRAHAPVDLKTDRLWCNGPSFDESILAAAYRALGRKTPWRYNAARDCRTIYDLNGLKLQHTVGVFHKADDDAAEQARLVQHAYRLMFGGWGTGDLSEAERFDMSEILGGIRRAYQPSRRKADVINETITQLSVANAAMLGGFRNAILSHAIIAAGDINPPDGETWDAQLVREISLRMVATDLVSSASFLVHVIRNLAGEPFDPAAFALAAYAIAQTQDSEWQSCETAHADDDATVEVSLEAAQ